MKRCLALSALSAVATLTLLTVARPASALALFDGKQVATIVYQDQPALALAARLLAHDLEARSGLAPRLSTRLEDCGTVCVLIARHDAPLLRGLLPAARTRALDGQWERYARASVARGARRYLVLAGSDTRGAVWGVIDLTRELGVSAWEWWADVTPQKAARLDVADGARLSTSPSVQYRGVFLNDEDWGLHPWAAKTYDPALGDIGPKTYARVFELLWRLKANTIWPAMHDVTRPFYQVAGNAAMARDYAIVVGTSHAEPMMRNNVREWNSAERGPFNFFSNRAALLDYWRERVEETRADETIYSVGLRGIHDSAMEGAANQDMARAGLRDAIGAQRELLAAALGRPATSIPQALTLYKEVLDLYQAGLEVPDDVTLVWPDDNYGYLRQLNGPRESRRGGGAGIYYHLEYWGRPHDYLWLATTHPALVREQLERAWTSGARKLWIFNVGDIKPAEYLTSYVMDIAFDQRQARQAPRSHLEQWAARQFGAAQAPEIAALMTAWYDLAWERRPEFMGFGQTEPTTPNRPNAYLNTGGEEAERRLASYAALVKRAEALETAMPPERRDAFFELVLYPVRAAALLNARILDTALGRDAHAPQAALVADTARYNGLADGKWRYMMDLAPRRLPVFDPANPVPAPAPVPASPGASVVSLAAADAAPNRDWELVPGLGSRGAALRSMLSGSSAAAPGAALTYRFQLAATGAARVRIVALPVHPLHADLGLRIKVSIDGGAFQTLDFATRGRSEEWKINVLTNTALRTLALAAPAAGAHTVQVLAVDPGFILDRIDVLEDGAPNYYGAPPLK